MLEFSWLLVTWWQIRERDLHFSWQCYPHPEEPLCKGFGHLITIPLWQQVGNFVVSTWIIGSSGICCKRWFIANLQDSNRHVVSFYFLKHVILMGVKGQICAMTCGHRSTCMPRLPHAAVEMVKEKFSTLTLYVLTQQTSADGSMTKLLISFRSDMAFRYNPSACKAWIWIHMNLKYVLCNRNCVLLHVHHDWMCSCLVSYRDAVTLNEEIDDAAGKLKLLILSMKWWCQK